MIHILAVTSNRSDRNLVAKALAPESTYRCDFADSEEEIRGAIHSDQLDILLLDPAVTAIDGPGLVRSIQEAHPQVPVVLITSRGREAVAIQAFRNGASNYVPKHLIAVELIPTLRSVLQVTQQTRRRLRMLARLTDFHCKFELENDRELIATLVSYLQEHTARLLPCDDAELIRVGIALDEALTNALYHGNLELSSELREGDTEAYDHVAKQRAHEAPYAARRLRVEATISRDQAEFRIQDDGPGFDPNTLPDPRDPDNLHKVSGRGVLLMRSFMDEVSFGPRGNEVTLRKLRAAPPAPCPPEK